MLPSLGYTRLYTVIPNEGGLRALQYYFDKREILEPPADTLLRMAELILTLNTFELNGEYYKQTGGVAMGSRVGPKLCLSFCWPCGGTHAFQLYRCKTRLIQAVHG